MGKRGPGPQPETDQALQAFEDYWALGDDRSLPKLAADYRQRSDAGQGVPTRRLRTLLGWSSRWEWQARCRVRIGEEAERLRQKERQRNEAFRRRIRSAIEVDSARLIGRLQLAEDELLTRTPADLEKMTKLFLALGGEPLAEEYQVNGEVQVHQDAVEVLRSRMASLAARLGVGAETERTDPGGTEAA